MPERKRTLIRETLVVVATRAVARRDRRRAIIIAADLRLAPVQSMGIAKVVVVLDETHRRLHPRARIQPPRARRTITITTPPSDSRAPSPSPRMRLAAAAEAATEQTITTMVLDGTRTDTPAKVGLEVRIFEEARRVREATTWTSPRAI